MSSGLATHQDGARQQRPLNADFRVGSYVVHSPISLQSAGQSHRAASSHIPGYQFARARTLAPSAGPSKQPPRASPRPTAPKEMGDRLSSQRAADGDAWLSSPKTNRFVRQSAANFERRDSQPAEPAPAQVTPRLPRGVSRIPHQVQPQQDGATPDHRRESQASPALSPANGDQAKYLTFSKDQATSHLKSLREELAKQTTSSNANHRPSPVERQRVRVAQRAAELENSQPPVKQQPLCYEKFIMTGQSMLKLSCNESEISELKFRRRRPPSSSADQPDSLRSASLDQLSADANRPAAHLAEPAPAEPVPVEPTPAEPPLSEPYLSEQSPLGASEPGSLSSGKESQNSTSSDSVSSTRAQLEQRETHRGQLALDGRNSAGDDAHQTAQASEQTPAITTTTTDAPAAEQKPIRDPIQASAPNQLPPPTSQPPPGEEPEAQQPECNQVDSSVVKAECDTTTQPEEPARPMAQDADEGGPSCTDRDSAKRLAKRLYNLSGFKRSHVCHHLAKNNPFSKLVADEYLSLFDFRSMKLDAALRKFLSKLQLNGETQERERMLSVFSQRYFDCNRDKFPSAELVQTLVCAMILLNTDLHSGGKQNQRGKLSLGAFVDGLNSSLARPSISLSSSALSGVDGQQNAAAYTFPRHLLVDLYEAIRKRPLKCSDDKCDMSSFEAELDKIYSQQVGANRSNTLPTRRFAPGSNAPSSTLSANARRHLKQGLDRLNGQQDEHEAAIEFKSGPLNRKRVFRAGGQPIGKGRRSWRRVRVILHDLRLVMRPASKDDSKKQCNGAQSKQQQLSAKQLAKQRAQTVAQDMKNTVKLHHTLAKRSTSYTKRDHVFHLRLADQSEFLVQADNEAELDSWIDTINFASACLSSPALPSAISSAFKLRRRTSASISSKRPILPAAYTKLTYWEQLIDHEERLQRLKQELDDHLSEAPNTKNATKRDKTEFIEKIAYLKQEIERYTVYVDLMRKKSNSPEAIILSKHPQIASLTPSNEMILSLPSFAPSSSPAVESSSPAPDRKSPTATKS